MPIEILAISNYTKTLLDYSILFSSEINMISDVRWHDVRGLTKIY